MNRYINFKLWFLFFFLLLFPSTGFTQNVGPIFNQLRGMEDFNGNTHLFYRIYTFSGDSYINTSNNSVYHFDLSNFVDSLFLFDGGNVNVVSTSHSIGVLGYTFWDNDPSKLIYKKIECNIDCVSSVNRFDNVPINQGIFFIDAWPVISISNQNDSLLYTSATNILLTKSTDGGINWSFINSNDYLGFLSVSIFNDSVLFVLDIDRNILKSIDGGNSFYIVDTTKSSNYPQVPKIIYDSDSTHIYRASYSFNGTSHIQSLFVSDNKGETDSWTKKYTGFNSITIDYSETGVLYIAEENKILISNNYGNSFSIFKNLDSTIVDIYKKPGSNLLYAATRNDIFEITPTSTNSIKDILVSVDEEKNIIPSNFALYQNYPNPFNPSTTISYSIPILETGYIPSVQLKIYDVLGREITTLVNEEKPAGTYEVKFNAINLPSGIYFYRLQVGKFFETKKMILLR